jgi:hypothetical protein
MGSIDWVRLSQCSGHTLFFPSPQSQIHTSPCTSINKVLRMQAVTTEMTEIYTTMTTVFISSWCTKFQWESATSPVFHKNITMPPPSKKS